MKNKKHEYHSMAEVHAYIEKWNGVMSIERPTQYYFQNAIFKCAVDFRKFVFDNTVYFNGAAFEKGYDFSEALFECGIDIEGATFARGINIDGTTFGDNPLNLLFRIPDVHSYKHLNRQSIK